VAGVIHVEVLDRRGGVAVRVRIDTWPARIGRALSNEVAIDDPYVSPVHAELSRSEQGELRVRDLDSENGLFAGVSPSAPRAPSFPIAPGDIVRVGRTLLRVRTDDQVLAPTLVDTRPGQLSTWISSHRIVVVALLVAVGFAGFWRGYAFTWMAPNAVGLLVVSLKAVVLVSLWAGAWALATRLTRQESRIVEHFAISCLMFLAARGVDRAAGFAGFLNAPVLPMTVLSLFFDLTILALGIYAQLGIAGLTARVQRTAIAVLTATLAIGAFGLGSIDLTPDFTTELPVWTHLEPANPGLLPTKTTDEFFRDVEALQRRLQ
jgi:hypothetical protein